MRKILVIVYVKKKVFLLTHDMIAEQQYLTNAILCWTRKNWTDEQNLAHISRLGRSEEQMTPVVVMNSIFSSHWVTPAHSLRNASHTVPDRLPLEPLLLPEMMV